jgi:hypothetical protein
MFADTVRIEEDARPHPFPVLTLNTHHLQEDSRALAVLMHQQIRWHLRSNEERVDRLLEDLLKRPDDLVDSLSADLPPDTANYRDLIACALEYRILLELLGPAESEEVMDWRTGQPGIPHIYATARKHHEQIMAQIRRFRLSLPQR